MVTPPQPRPTTKESALSTPTVNEPRLVSKVAAYYNHLIHDLQMSGGESSSKCYSFGLADEEQSSTSPPESTMASLKCTKPAKKTIYIIIGVILAVVILLVALGTHLGLKGGDDCPTGVNCDWKSVPASEFLKDSRCDDVCHTRPCIKAAIYSMKRIDESQDPCDDFYKFACGSFVNGDRSSASSGSDGDSSMKELERAFILDIRDVLERIPSNGNSFEGSALRYAKTFYTNCLLGNTAEYESRTTEFLHKLFGSKSKLPWPLLNKDPLSSVSRKVVESSMAYLSTVSSNPFFQTELIHRPRSRSWIIDLKIPKFGPLIQVYSEGHDGDDRIDVYMDAMVYILEIMGVDNTTRINTVKEIVKFERALLEEQLKADRESESTFGETGRHYKCEDMSVQYRQINWCKFISDYLPMMGISTGLPVSIRVRSPAYFKALDYVIERAITRELLDYMNIKFLINFQQYLTGRFQHYHYQDDVAFRKLPIYRSAPTYWERCVLLTMEQLWPVVIEKYTSIKFTDKMEEKFENMISEMNSTMVDAINGYSWMDENGKRLIIDEFNRGTTIISLRAYSDVQENYDKHFSMMSFEKRPLIEDVLDVMKLKNKLLFDSKDTSSILFKTADLFFLDNSFETDANNHVYGPVYSRFPLLDFERPKYLDYSTLGQIILYPMQRILALYSDLTDSDDVADVVSERNECIKKEYSRYSNESSDDEEGENGFAYSLFDALTLQSTFKAYEKKLKDEDEEKGLPGLPLSNRQLFFIFYAQLHCESGIPYDYDSYSQQKVTPANVRVNGAVSQSPEFGKAFRCSEGSRMNTATKCCLMSSKENDKNCM